MSTPSKAAVERTIKALECDDEEAEALRRFYERERPGFRPNWRAIGWYALVVVFWSITLAVGVILFLAAL